MEAARTCSRLLSPSVHLISGHVVSQTAVQVVADVLSKLLVVGITDPGTAKHHGRWSHLKVVSAIPNGNIKDNFHPIFPHCPPHKQAVKQNASL